jgi:hypothetical protein
MARAAGQNVVMSSSIPGAGAKDAKPCCQRQRGQRPLGRNVQEHPGLEQPGLRLRSDIIRVMTLNDMAQQSKLREEENNRIRKSRSKRP